MVFFADAQSNVCGNLEIGISNPSRLFRYHHKVGSLPNL